VFSPSIYYVSTGNSHLPATEVNNLPAPVAFVVVANEPAGAVVVVVPAVMAVVKKYKPAVPLAIVAPVVAVEVKVPLTVAVVKVEPVIVEPVIVASVIVVPETSSGSEYATPTGLVLGIIFP
jgi:hypothetical protein